MGGLPGVLAALGLIFTRVFKNQMTEGINNLAFSLQSLIGITETSAEKVKKETFNLATSMAFDGGSEAEDRYGQNLKQTLTLKEKIREISGSITAEEKELLGLRQQIANITPDLVAGYTAQGDPILKLNGSLKNTIKLMERQAELQQKILMNMMFGFKNLMEKQVTQNLIKIHSNLKISLPIFLQ